ncbi:E3 ubiquitin-protein ligase RHF2A [Salix suchowensis]|nr:E3 ubiquitin-protein ligase RHF2A [Salix suchowensis]
MEVLEVDEAKKPEVHMTSESCDDACSICLEDFCESDPSTVTNCKHEFHLQCILEWCQRSSECPMCCDPSVLKIPPERERKIRAVPSRNATIFHHLHLGILNCSMSVFYLVCYCLVKTLQLPVGVSDSELEERIIQHLAAAAIGRTHHLGRRKGREIGRENELAGGSVASPSTPLTSAEDEPSQQALQLPSILSDQRSFNNRSTSSQSALPNPDRAGPSEFQSCPNSLKSRLNAVSMRYKESISRSTRAWKERLFSRNSSMSDIGSEVQREVNAGIATVSRLMDRLETRDNSGANQVSVSTHRTDRSVAERSNQNNAETHTESL